MFSHVLSLMFSDESFLTQHFSASITKSTKTKTLPNSLGSGFDRANIFLLAKSTIRILFSSHFPKLILHIIKDKESSLFCLFIFLSYLCPSFFIFHESKKLTRLTFTKQKQKKTSRQEFPFRFLQQ